MNTLDKNDGTRYITWKDRGYMPFNGFKASPESLKNRHSLDQMLQFQMKASKSNLIESIAAS